MVMSGVEYTREDLEHLWKARVENVKIRLDFATHHLKEIGDDHRLGRIPPTDPDARENAIRAYTEVLAEYVSVSKIYQDLVLHGKVPDGVVPWAETNS
jgi:hypothetical protein